MAPKTKTRTGYLFVASWENVCQWVSTIPVDPYTNIRILQGIIIHYECTGYYGRQCCSSVSTECFSRPQDRWILILLEIKIFNSNASPFWIADFVSKVNERLKSSKYRVGEIGNFSLFIFNILIIIIIVVVIVVVVNLMQCQSENIILSFYMNASNIWSKLLHIGDV